MAAVRLSVSPGEVPDCDRTIVDVMETIHHWEHLPRPMAVLTASDVSPPHRDGT